MKRKTPLYQLAICLLGAFSFSISAQAEVKQMINSDLSVNFGRSIEPNQSLYDEAAGGSTFVTGQDDPIGGEGSLRFTDQSAFLAPRIIGVEETPITSQFRISLKAYNNAYVEGGSRGARLRFGVDEIGLITSESRVAATVTFKQDNSIQAKGDTATSGGELFAESIELNTVYDVDIIVNVDGASSYTYNYRGTEMTLDPASYHVMVDGQLITDLPANGLGFALASGTAYASWAETNGNAIDQIGFISSTADDGVDWYFSDMVLATGADVPVEGDTGPATEWAGYDIFDDVFVDTGSALGVLYVELEPYVYSYLLEDWLYIEQSAVLDGGIWMHVF